MELRVLYSSAYARSALLNFPPQHPYHPLKFLYRSTSRKHFITTFCSSELQTGLWSQKVTTADVYLPSSSRTLSASIGKTKSCWTIPPGQPSRRLLNIRHLKASDLLRPPSFRLRTTDVVRSLSKPTRILPRNSDIRRPTNRVFSAGRGGRQNEGGFLARDTRAGSIPDFVPLSLYSQLQIS